MSKPARLITIPFSHYCEKARWALDHVGMPYVESRWLPMMHMLGTRPVGGKMVPALVTRHGTLKDSAAIVKHCDAHASLEKRLYPRDVGALREVEAIEALCNDVLGPAARLHAYFHILPRANDLASMVRPGMTAAQRVLFPLAVPLVAPVIKRRYRIDAASAAHAVETIRAAFAELGARLQDRRYFVGDAFTAADLTFASLATPALLPPGHPMLTSNLELLDAEMRATIEEMRRTRAGEHALRLYRENRHAKNA